MKNNNKKKLNEIKRQKVNLTIKYNGNQNDGPIIEIP